MREVRCGYQSGLPHARGTRACRGTPADVSPEHMHFAGDAAPASTVLPSKTGHLPISAACATSGWLSTAFAPRWNASTAQGGTWDAGTWKRGTHTIHLHLGCLARSAHRQEAPKRYPPISPSSGSCRNAPLLRHTPSEYSSCGFTSAEPLESKKMTQPHCTRVGAFYPTPRMPAIPTIPDPPCLKILGCPGGSTT